MQRPGSFRAGSFFAGGVLEYAKSPLVLEDPDTGRRDVVLDHVFAGNVSAGGAIHERLRFDVLVPLYFTSVGPEGSQGVGLGDIRVAGMLMGAIPERNGGWGIAVVPWADLPSGVDEEYLGQRAIGGGGVLAGTREWSRVTATANLGAQFSPRTDLRNLDNADSLVAGLGGAFSVTPDTGVGLEVAGKVPFTRPEVSGTGTPFEATASVRHVRDNGGFLSGGIATALTNGAGAAAFRAFIGGGFGAHTEDFGSKDRDGDGFVNREDDCPDEPETVNGLDDTDGCPDALPKLTVTVLQDGAQADNAALRVSVDDSPVFDDTVAAPAMVQVPPGPVEVRAERGPCRVGESSLDVTGDQGLDLPLKSVRDALLQLQVRTADGSAVPQVSAVLTPSDEGCESGTFTFEDGNASDYVGPTTWRIAVEAPGYHPFQTGVMMMSGGDETVEIVLVPQVALQKVRIEEKAIVLLEQVHFDTGRATLRPGASAILDEVVIALHSVPGRGSVEVQGHTDNVGSEDLNQRLSQKRAETVRKYLVAKGIPATRVKARGYGETAPTTTNRTPAGRQQNRRVEFIFVNEE